MNKMNRILTTLLIVLSANFGIAQIDQISVGAAYRQATYYSLGDGSTTSIDHTAWDIAFALGPQDLGVFVNEGVGSGGQEPLPEVALYLSQDTAYATADTTGMVRLYNNEISWAAGAFNHVATGDDPLDFGWGSYNVSTHAVNGTRVFILQLRDGSFRKLFIESLIGGVYTFKYAALDGSDEVSQSIAKSDFPGKTLAYYSFAEQAVLDLEPDSWDLLFTRYVTPLDDGAGNILDYLVTGILINDGVQVAVAGGIDPQTVSYETMEAEFEDTLTTIGYDWKHFDLATFQWSVPNDRVYFIQTPTDSIWKVQFLDFEGSSTGVSTLEKTLESVAVSGTSPLPDYADDFRIYPNPSGDQRWVELELAQTLDQTSRINIYNQWGQVVAQRPWSLHQGRNKLDLQLELEPGIYYLQILWGKDQVTQSFTVVK